MFATVNLLGPHIGIGSLPNPVMVRDLCNRVGRPLDPQTIAVQISTYVTVCYGPFLDQVAFCITGHPINIQCVVVVVIVVGVTCSRVSRPTPMANAFISPNAPRPAKVKALHQQSLARHFECPHAHSFDVAGRGGRRDGLEAFLVVGGGAPSDSDLE